MKKWGRYFCSIALVSIAAMTLTLQGPFFAGATEDLLDDDFYEDEIEVEEIQIADPLEPINRVFFEVNDVFYFYFLKPVKNGYRNVVSYDNRYILGNFFYNLVSPVRFLNNLLQGEFKDAGIVLSRFVINTTMGVFGFGDPAAREFGIQSRPADFGQTLGRWGVGAGMYIHWPILGPSTVRDSVGFVGDLFLDPVEYVSPGVVETGLYRLSTRINKMSLQKNDTYEEIKKISFDPYIAVRQAYYDYRRGLIGQQE